MSNDTTPAADADTVVTDDAAPLDTTTLSDFTGRHVGPTESDVQQMLQVVGYDSLSALVSAATPPTIQGEEPLAIEAAPSEQAAIAELRELASRNRLKTSMIGLGYYGTQVPPVVKRNILENPAWYTAYTPYQPEISQGRLEALMNFQTMLADLTGLDIANASLLDEATAAAEAMALMRRNSKVAQDAVILVDQHLLPQTLAVVTTRATPLDIDVVSADLEQVSDAAGLRAAAGDREVFGVLVQYPGGDGLVRDWKALADAAHEVGALLTVAADLLALTLIAPPGAWGADVAVGTTQRFGVPMGFGGPHAGYISIRKGLERTLPGRLVGLSKDDDGAPGYRLSLQTREQHIRREKATSNITTAQVLLAVMAGMYAVWHGPDGLRRIALETHAKARVLADALTAGGVELAGDTWFDTLQVKTPGKAADVLAAALERDINLWQVDADTVQLSTDELTTLADLQGVAEAFGVEVPSQIPTVEAPDFGGLARTEEQAYLTHPVFNTYRSETAMLRYIRSLADKDFALDRGMIPLGSCTMKLNSTTEMEPITWPEFSTLHPFVPNDQSEGTRALIDQLAGWLCEITGYDEVSLQPNSGANGEFAGLLAIRRYHQANGQGERNICLIPASAHGTNAASAVMAGLKVVVVKSTSNGEIDMDDLRAKVDKHRDELAAIMITYPSTHGVYEAEVTQLCELIHDAGGQVYLDGANLNALMGIAKPGKFGSDVSHLNLHKTFTIPHGGGGPGVGPIGVRSHLAPYLPGHTVMTDVGPETSPGPVAAAPYGSASILPIPWAYIRLVGGAGLQRSSEVAVLSANYIARRLNEHFPVLYTGANDLVAHECILDLRGLTKDTGVTVDDVAKRLIDYGFHAPTMSFPVAGTLMVEPTESEDLGELDRFIDAMIKIRHEMDEAAAEGVEGSVLRNAPHTALSIAGEWDQRYDRMTATFPEGVDPARKYWPPVRRIDGVYGDRNLIATLPASEDAAG